MAISVWQERKVFERTDVILTASEWSRGILERQYFVPPTKVVVISNSPMIPPEAIPHRIDIRRDKDPAQPLRLLFVGRVAHRKGLDIAEETACELTSRGVKTHLTVVGMDGEGSQETDYVGLLRKGDPEELNRYVQFFRSAHFLIHPARFEAAGIVPSEAAAFGTPTITNDVGGLATTVKDGVSGVVLPRDCGPQRYADAIEGLLPGSVRYFEMCAGARARYENELRWDHVEPRFGTCSSLQRSTQ